MTETILTQYNFGKGIKLFVKEGKSAVKVELNQLNYRNVMVPINSNNMLGGGGG